MKTIIKLAAILVLAASCCRQTGASLPKAEGYNENVDSISALMLQRIRRVHSTGELNSLMVLKDGKKVLEYYDVCYGPDFLNILWSCSKTFTATAVGFAVQDGLLDVNDKLIKYLTPGQLPENVSDTLASLTLYDLLRMSSGFKSDYIGTTGSCELKDPVKATLEDGFIFAPGERFKYNSLNTYMLSVVVTAVTGKKVGDYLDEKLFQPLGIKDWHWDTSAEGYHMGGWGLYLSTESMAKMGQFMLQKGVWDGKRLLNEDWFDAAMSAQIIQNPAAPESDWNLGYGYQMWMCQHGAARLDGAHGQFVVILPEENAVIVLTGNTNNNKDEFQGIWDIIYPIVK